MTDLTLDDFHPDERDRRTRLNTLMDDWKKQVSKSQVLYRADGKYYPGDAYFCADGFFPYYYHQKRKILFIARETVDMSGRDYIADLFKGYRENSVAGKSLDQHLFHSRMMYLAYGILHDGMVPFEKVPWASEIRKTFGTTEGISFAFMELSKYSNDNEDANDHRDVELINSFLRDSDLEKRHFFQEELRLLDPDLIITMNLWNAGIDSHLLDKALDVLPPPLWSSFYPQNLQMNPATFLPPTAAFHPMYIYTKDPGYTPSEGNVRTSHVKVIPLLDLYHFSSRKNTKTDFYDPVMTFMKHYTW